MPVDGCLQNAEYEKYGLNPDLARFGLHTMWICVHFSGRNFVSCGKSVTFAVGLIPNRRSGTLRLVRTSRLKGL